MMRPNHKTNPLNAGHWRGRPMNTVRLRTIALNLAPRKPTHTP